jgi:hypothetical protein
MSVLQYPVPPRSFAVPARLSRLLLLCRFDFRQRNWSLPSWETHHDFAPVSPAHSAAQTAALFKHPSDFSDPALGGSNPSKAFARRFHHRHLPRWSLGKNKTTKTTKK